ncbi:GTPase, partial [Alcanivorax sp. HI0044]|uniref:dynamin family protein n=2 Tax=unclassified Alcanivorax TaxID=2638842 RepID=UPI0007B91E5D
MTVSKDRLLSARQSLESILAKYDDICDASIKRLIKDDGVYSSQEIESHLATLQEEGRNLKIGIIGRVKAGKSSLINGLLFDGKEVLPKAATPMTAALTSIGYAGEFCAEVKFFNQDDIDDLKIKASIYDREVNAAIQRYREEHLERKERANRPLPDPKDELLRKKALREVGEDGALSAAADLYKRIKDSSVNVGELTDRRLLTANTVEELNAQLMDYVGSSGRYMPFTRELNLGMPLESLKGIEILDTPGVNDPVKSREQRTYERLKECNAAFIVSPAGQFMSEQDFELADRLSGREGTQEIYIVASQADTQLHSSIRRDAKGVLPQAIEILRATMAEQAERSLSNCENEILKSIAKNQGERLILTAGICEALVLGKGSSGDETASHAMGLLKKNYPDYFSNPDNLMDNLEVLSGRRELERAIEKVRSKKIQILEAQSDDFIEAQWRAFVKTKEAVLESLSGQRSEVENSDIEKIQERLSALNVASYKGVEASNQEFLDQIEDMHLRLPADLRSVIQRAMDMFDEKAEGAEGVSQETRRVEKEGVGSWFARKLSMGGYEERTFEIETVRPLPIRRSLEGFSRLMTQGLRECAEKNILSRRSALVSGLSRQLREVIGDENVDITRLKGVCRATVERILDFPSVSVPDLPADLAKSREIKGWGVGEFVEAAHSY